MVVNKGNRELRSFTVVKAQDKDGCSTKFNNDSRLVSSTPNSAAKKAFSRLCNLKRVKGKCTFIVTIMDTTNNHSLKGKEYTYKIERKKLDKPIVLQAGTNKEYKINYTVKAKKAFNKKEPTNCKNQSSGIMMKQNPRKNKQEEKKRRKKTLKNNKSSSNSRKSNGKSKNNGRSLMNRLRIN